MRVAPQSAESAFVQFGPDARTGAEGQQANRLATTAQGQDEQPGAPILVGLGIAHHRTRAVIHLCLLAGSGDDHHAGFGRLGAAQLAHEALHALVAAGETVLVDQVLPDRHGIAAAAESQFDGFPIRGAGTGAGTALWRCRVFREKSGVPAKFGIGFVGCKSAHFVSLEGVEVGDHLVGRFCSCF